MRDGVGLRLTCSDQPIQVFLKRPIVAAQSHACYVRFVFNKRYLGAHVCRSQVAFSEMLVRHWYAVWHSRPSITVLFKCYFEEVNHRTSLRHDTDVWRRYCLQTPIT